MTNCLYILSNTTLFCMKREKFLEPYDFYIAENTDRIVEFNRKNGINCKTRNIGDCAKVWIQFIKIRGFPTIIRLKPKHFFDST